VERTRLRAAMSNMPAGLCMVDRDQRIVVANQRYADMYGLTKDDVRPGGSIRRILERRIERGLYAGKDVQEYLRERLTVGSEASTATYELQDGRTILISREPIADGGWIDAHQDITEREKLSAQLARQNELLKQREQELERQNQRLDAALDNMLQGLAMFDPEQRLIVCNKRYAEMYGLTREQVQPGTTVREIFQHRMANGTYHVKDTESFVESWAGDFGTISSRIQELADGRIVIVSRQRLPDGGRLVTHEDITNREKLKAQLEEQHELLKQRDEKLHAQNVQLDAALNNIVQGLAMFDADYRLVLCNERYAQIYRLRPEQVRPGTTLRRIIEQRIDNGLGSDRTPDQIVDAMLSRREVGDFEQFCSHLSDGRDIAITVRPMVDGGTVTTHQDITEQRRSEAKIAHMALHDTLTGLPNRVLFNERLEHALTRVSRGEITAIHLFDLDYFKNVNDTLGHPTGDKLLKMVAERLRTLVRETDTVARMGGDEFAIVQVDIKQPADATLLAHRVTEVVGAPYEIDGHQVIVGASVGIAVGPTDGQAPEQLMRNADLALYRAKGDGRNTYRFFEQDMDAAMQARRTMECDLRKALNADEFVLFYQPIVNLAHDEITGFEALIRWRHPGRGLVSPGEFIPLAEEIGIIEPIGEWVLRTACATASTWPEHLSISVNLSPLQFRSPALVQMVVSALAASGLAASRLELEITETVLIEDRESTLSLLFQLRELGVQISMDDFGTGYSSLSYLQCFPFDRIKIDRSFIKDITDTTGSLNIVRAVTAMARGLGMTTTAEGVETKEQLEAIRSEGCTDEVDRLLDTTKSRAISDSVSAA
jgi:diguanylate cyclase (GGDEF)-like protein/PAS domain S-box-containing protein